MQCQISLVQRLDDTVVANGYLGVILKSRCRLQEFGK